MAEIEREPSRTAAGVAWLRAAHQVVDDPPRILDDPIAPQAARRRPADGHSIERRAELFTPGALALRAHVLLRSRYAEDRLAAAARRGVDSSSSSVPASTPSPTGSRRGPRAMRIFEVDQPSSQAVKRDRIARAGIEVPSNVTYAAVDFESEDLMSGLVRAGVDPTRPAFISWLGVSMYLTGAAVDRGIPDGRHPSRSNRAGVHLRAAALRPGPSLADRAAAVGEPWLSYFEPDELREVLTAAGFSTVGFLQRRRCGRYFAGRTDSLVAPRRVSIAVGPGVKVSTRFINGSRGSYLPRLP